MRAATGVAALQTAKLLHAGVTTVRDMGDNSGAPPASWPISSP
ncbi:MAG TPA: hypothetical protein VEO54_08770 [Thermoanaerobaculia bacterium]|nr:hypothetical protein [Thermoanaerobaculia bacterium]